MNRLFLLLGVGTFIYSDLGLDWRDFSIPWTWLVALALTVLLVYGLVRLARKHQDQKVERLVRAKPVQAAPMIYQMPFPMMGGQGVNQEAPPRFQNLPLSHYELL